MTEFEEAEEKSKSQVKRELIALQKLGQHLMALPDKALAKLPLTDKFREAITHGKTLRMGALARQLKHIGKLMRDEQVEEIHAALELQQQPHQAEVQSFHEVESWRDALLAGDDGQLEQLCIRFPQLDRQHCRQLVRNANKEQLQNKPPKAARALFQYLKQLVDSAGNDSGN